MTAPPFILSPVSLTEFPGESSIESVQICLWCAKSSPIEAYWCERPELFAAIADGKTPEERAIAVLRWFIVRRI